MEINHSHLILDACCVINFYASGRMEEILEALPAQVAISELVYERELLTVRDPSTGESEEIDLQALISDGILSIIPFTEEEEVAFVNYAAVLKDDGESATFAIAIERDWAIATDDKRAINFGRVEAPQLQRITTLQVVKHWADSRRLSEEKVRATLRSIRERGNFLPPRFDPLKEWWKSVIGS